MIKVIVAEPNQVLRVGIRSVLESDAGFSILAEAVNVEAFRQAFLDIPHDVVLIELGLLKEIGVPALRELRAARPTSRILVHCYENDIDFGIQACRFGASGYLSNDCSPSELRAAVANVARGQIFITKSLGEELAMAACFRTSSLPYADLNRQELLVFKMLCIGMRMSDVAMQLRENVETVAYRKTKIMAKMKLPDLNDLVQCAIAQSLKLGYARLPLPWRLH